MDFKLVDTVVLKYSKILPSRVTESYRVNVQWNFKNHSFQTQNSTGEEMNQETVSHDPKNAHLLITNDDTCNWVL